MAELLDYFGCLKGHDLSSFSREKVEKLLLAKGILEPKHVVRLSQIEKQVFPPSSVPILKPGNNFANNFYVFLLQHYENGVLDPFYAFFYQFNDEIYGMDMQQQKTVALEHFKTISGEILTKAISFIWTEKNPLGIDTVSNMGKLQMLHGQQLALKSNLADSTLKYPYLQGDDSYFNQELLFENDLIKQIIHFETHLKILLALNEKYHFEVDTCFSTNLEEKDNPIRDVVEAAPKDVAPTNPFKLPKKSTKITDKEAMDYLLKTIFDKKKK
ncbi:hypothetical protein GGR42_003385 [Saonia flava]|uniref:Uncharacterized protein n=1 Tax=Saonia flava TaxID=523696 RepID=A0A846R0B7_9FLAO|nr:hypothetical protein [Saonia flava]NJB72887.1 hypothetical protein [Saonia flava]